MSGEQRLSVTEFRHTRNVASARDLKPVPVVSNETGILLRILRSNPILASGPVARSVHTGSQYDQGERQNPVQMNQVLLVLKTAP